MRAAVEKIDSTVVRLEEIMMRLSAKSIVPDLF
jgi:hypothetical protein